LRRFLIAGLSIRNLVFHKHLGLANRARWLSMDQIAPFRRSYETPD
jgi:hypothetical protein